MEGLFMWWSMTEPQIDIADLCTLGIQVSDTKLKREYRNNIPIVVH